MKSEKIENLAAALCKVQGELRGYREDSKNPFFKSKYGDLASVWKAIRGPLAENGLAVSQTMDSHHDTSEVIVVTTLMHTSGEWLSGALRMPLAKPDPQGVGSAITYARRYALAAIVGVAPEDDDAEGATYRDKKPEPRKPPKKKENPQKKADKTAKPKWLVAMSKKADQHNVPSEHRKDWIEACVTNPKRLDLATEEQQKELAALLDDWIMEKAAWKANGKDGDPPPFPPEPEDSGGHKGERGRPADPDDYEPAGLSEDTLKKLYDIGQNNPEIPNTRALYQIAETFTKRKVEHLDELTEEEAQKMIKRLKGGE